MFEDVFEPLDDIIKKEEADEWVADVWDTGDKEDLWRSDPPTQDVWSTDPKEAPKTSKSKIKITKSGTIREEEHSEPSSPPRGSGIFDDLFLNIM